MDCTAVALQCVCVCVCERERHSERETEICIDDQLVRIHFITEMIQRTVLAPWAFDFPDPGSLISSSDQMGMLNRECVRVLPAGTETFREYLSTK